MVSLDYTKDNLELKSIIDVSIPKIQHKSKKKTIRFFLTEGNFPFNLGFYNLNSDYFDLDFALGVPSIYKKVYTLLN